MTTSCENTWKPRWPRGSKKNKKGEHFTLIDPPRFPQKPYKPNRLKILLIGLVLAIGSGIALTTLLEMNDYSIRDSDTLTLATSFPVLAGIPEIVTQEDIRRKKKKRIMITVAIVLCLAAAVVAFNSLVMNLNVLWMKLMQRVPF
jgi:uncharacterized membrane protein HdeD (DUF308 family)